MVVSARGAERLRCGGGPEHVARTDIKKPPPLGSGDVVELRDEAGKFLASALWAQFGPIAARVWDRNGRELNRQVLVERIAAANARRQQLFADGAVQRDAYRVVHGEADMLPGLLVDRYADVAVVQTATAAMDVRKPLIAEVLVEVLQVSQVLCRDDGSARDLEGLPRQRGVLHGPKGASTRVRFHDAGSLMESDLLAARKTGSFLDQQENHAAVATYAARLFAAPRQSVRALDCFSFHGGFALALARAGLSVTACDEDSAAIEQARQNAALNRVAVDFRVANAFDLLRSLESSGARFDVVVLDPPALAKRGRSRGHAPSRLDADSAWQRAYKELNLRALRLLSPGGLLCTCSCSGRVSESEFGALIESAVRDAGRTQPRSWQIIERRGAGRDHPVLIGWPESEYLKCWLLRALR